MDTLQNDLEAIRKILAELNARVDRIEGKLGMVVQPAVEPRAAATENPR